MTSRLLLLTLLLAGFAAVVDHVRPAGAQPRVVMLASTIGPVDAGIVGALEDAYLKRTGVVVRHVGVGTGAALEIAKGGSFDLVMVHARSIEDQFVADGFGVDRRDVMYNDFVILGPAGDRARIRGEKKAVDALRKIAGAQAPFLTRGDRSGTHVKEVELWEAAGVKPQGSWHVTSERGAAGNVATTRDANTRQAYVLMDRATYLTLRKEITLAVLVERDPVLLNYIAVIRVNPAKLPRVNADGARAFQDWLVSEEAQRIIKGFEVDRYGEPLFFPNSDDWRKRFGGAS
ncbi:MAG: substrate-binding domain-containing protein [Candidatus Rokuibacteriota bacterium]|jgi:tungstate transport system substrate-binding protein